VVVRLFVLEDDRELPAQRDAGRVSHCLAFARPA
jgi:hypothetical protein